MKNLISTGVVSLVLLASATASAAVCVQVDEARDNLAPAERTAVKTMVEESLRGQNQDVGDTNCDTIYKIYSLRLGNSVTAHVSGPNGSKSQKAASIEDLPETYDQLTRSLLNGETGKTATAGVDRHNVTKEQSARRRVTADSLWYFRLGYGAVVGGNFASGPAFGFGYRYELDELGLEISGNFVAATDSSDAESLGLSGSWIRLGGLYFFDPIANHSPHLNLGLSWGAAGVNSQYEGETYLYSGSGIQGEVGAGYEFLRASTIRLFVEANAVVPFYTATPNSWNNIDDSLYTPTFTLSVGVGYGSSNRSAVEVY